MWVLPVPQRISIFKRYQDPCFNRLDGGVTYSRRISPPTNCSMNFFDGASDPEGPGSPGTSFKAWRICDQHSSASANTVERDADISRLGIRYLVERILHQNLSWPRLHDSFQQIVGRFGGDWKGKTLA